MITTQEELVEYAASLEGSKRFAIDTEADSLYCYQEKLCLVQVSADGRDVLIDPLVPLDLAPLLRVLEKANIVMHGADYDIRLFSRHGLSGFGKLFDTGIAARILGEPQFGLAALLQKFFNVELAKASQKANWGRRPLKPEMIEYAMNDTRHLLALAELLEARLEQLGRTEWCRQMTERSIVSALAPSSPKETPWRVTGGGHLKNRPAAILRALWTWRDAEASATDRPAFHILQNSQLVDAALAFDRGETPQFRALRGSRERRFYDAATQALNLPQSEWPVFEKKPRLRATKEQEAGINALKAKRDKIAVDLGIDSSLIAPRSVIEAIVYEHPEAISSLLPFQKELLGF